MLERAWRNVADDEGWAMLSPMASHIHANHPDFDPRDFGCTKFSELVRKSSVFELVPRAHKGGHSYFCRLMGNAARIDGQDTMAASPFIRALMEAVRQATAANGWAPIGIIGQKLKALGHTVKESGRATLTDALTDTGIFETKGAGAARYFRARQRRA